MNRIDVKELDEQALFSQALEVVNQAIHRHKDDFPYKQMFAAAEKLMGDAKMGVALTKEAGADPYDYYTVDYEDGRWKLAGRGRQGDPDVTWTVTRDYLEEVVRNPDRYLEHPEKLDLDWLKSRLGIS